MHSLPPAGQALPPTQATGRKERRLFGVECAGSSSTWKWIFILGRSWPGKGLGEADGVQTAAGTGLLGHHQSGDSGEHQRVLEVPGGGGAGMGQRSSSGGERPTHNEDMVITQAGPVSFPAGQTGISAARGAGGAGVKIRHGLFCGPSGEMAHTGCQGGGLAGRRGIGGEGWATGEA